MIVHVLTVMRLKETHFQVPFLPLPEQVLKLRVEMKLLLSL